MRVKPHIIVALSLPFLSLVGPHAQAAEGIVADGASYASARETLVKGGYKPVSHEGAARCSAFTEICTAYPEAATCASGTTGTCRFEWTRAGGTGGGATVIETRGEAPDRLIVVRSYDAATMTPYPLGTTN